MNVQVNFVNKISDIGTGNAVNYRHFNTVVDADEFARSVRDNGGYANVFLDGKLIGTFVNFPE
jgi:hypothetical protein|tara:strand:- start:1047 stop:1235 length:189 start_codon:yes stop_codon:yes gene_type:complete